MEYSLNKVHLLVKASHPVGIVLSTRSLDDVAVIINVLTLLLQNETFKELGQNSVSCQKFNRRAVRRSIQNLWYQVGSDFLGLSCQDTEWKLSKFRSGVVQQELGEDHTRGQAVNGDGSLGDFLVVSLHAFIQFLDKGSGQLRKSTLCRTIARVARSTTSLDTRPNSVEDTTSNTSLDRFINQLDDKEDKPRRPHH